MLVGCKEQRTYTLLFTSDYEYGKDISYIVNYDKKGNILKTQEIEGALFYNVLTIDEYFYLNNGKKTVLLNENLQIVQENENKENLGIIEFGDSFKYKENIFNIHNYGYENDSNYITKISTNNKDKTISINGRLLNYIMDNDYLYMLISIEKELVMTIVNLNTLKIEKSVPLETIDSTTDVFGIKETAINNSMIYFKVSDNVTEICSYNITQSTLQKDNIDVSPLITLSVFEHDNKIYYFSETKELMYLDESRTQKNTGIYLPKEFGTFLIVKKINNILYVLDSSSQVRMSIIDLESNKRIDEINFETMKRLKNLDVYSFS